MSGLECLDIVSRMASAGLDRKKMVKNMAHTRQGFRYLTRCYLAKRVIIDTLITINVNFQILSLTVKNVNRLCCLPFSHLMNKEGLN